MALTPILNMDTDIYPFFGMDCCDDPALARLLTMCQRFTESQARKYVAHGIAQATYTEYQRKNDIGYIPTTDEINVIGDTVYLGRSYARFGEYLQLDNAFVRSVTSVYEDLAAFFGQGSSDFAAGTLLTAGTDYFMELDKSGMCRSGRLVRVYRHWSSRPGTIKITYVAGFTSAELDDEYSFVKEALLQDMMQKFQYVRSQQGTSVTGAGPIVQESIGGGEYVVKYADLSASRSVISSLSPMAKAKLQPIVRINL